jgi:PKD repeat protein
VADFEASPTEGALPLTVNFSDGSSGQIDTYLWSFGDSSTSTFPSPNYVYITSGTYTVSLTVSGPGGQHTRVQSGLMTVNAASPCSSQCLRVSNIQFGANEFGQPLALVTVEDENGMTVTGLSVTAVWTFPDGDSVELLASSSDAEASVMFVVEEAMPGLHTLTVTNVTKSGAIFDPANSTLRNSTLIGEQFNRWLNILKPANLFIW